MRKKTGRFLFILNVMALGLMLAVTNQAGAAENSGHAQKAEDVLAPPQKAIISPHGAHIESSQKVKLFTTDGQAALEFVIPADGVNLRIDIPGETISRWDTTPVILEPSSKTSSRREQALAERDRLVASVAAIKARLAVWQGQTAPASPQELERRLQMMASEMPALARQQSDTEKQIALLEREISELPSYPSIGQRITVVLAGDRKDEVTVNYSYDLENCGWQAVYDFNAQPDDGIGERVEVRLQAEVWQYTGMDWNNTDIILATLGAGPREPAPLPKWVVGAAPQPPKPEAKPVSLGARVGKAAGADHPAMTSAMEDTLAPPMAPVSGNTDAIYAYWSLSAKGLPEGRSRLEITRSVWKAPLQWIARPTTNDNRVWLMAKCELPQDQAWPAGMAQFSVNNQSVGSGSFNPKGREATLYFGADPRVSIATTVDKNTQGQTGFINTSKTWTGAWTYTIANEHVRPITVKVERPAPMIANETITVNYKNKPEGKIDDKEHMIYWDVTVPAHGKTAIEHSITISSPEKLPLLPDVP